jgi:hypothetical protein
MPQPTPDSAHFPAQPCATTAWFPLKQKSQTHNAPIPIHQLPPHLKIRRGRMVRLKGYPGNKKEESHSTGATECKARLSSGEKKINRF